MLTCARCLSPVLEHRCRKCGSWVTTDVGSLGTVSKAKTTTLDQVKPSEVPRLVTGLPVDECWGGGIVPTSTTLLGGSPGAGKTTLQLQLCARLAEMTGKRAYYFSAEQAPSEIRIVADRLCLSNLDRIRVMAEFGSGAGVEDELLKTDPPACFVVDSVSAMCGKDRDAAVQIAKRYKTYAAKHQAPAFIICHVTKDNDYAGLLTLQHEVDTLVTLSGEDSERKFLGLLKAGHSEELLENLRVLTAWKNRYGATGKDYHLAMTGHGLVALPEPPETPTKRGRKGKGRSADDRRESQGFSQAVSAPLSSLSSLTNLPAPIGGMALAFAKKRPKQPREARP